MDLLNSVKYLYLRELSEPRDNSLRIVVQEAVGNPAGSVRAEPELPELAAIMNEYVPIEPTESCMSFELYWKRYVAYLVTEECVGSSGDDKDEVYESGLLRVYTKSHFLEHLERDTGGHTEPIQHYKLICLNHLIDVASYMPPEIRQLGLASRTPPRFISEWQSSRDSIPLWNIILLAITIYARAAESPAPTKRGRATKSKTSNQRGCSVFRNVPF
jgi:hypothetical protein